MEYKKLGKSDLDSSRMILGSWRWKEGAVEQKQIDELVDAAFDNGINFIDSADVYGRGYAEQILGDALRNSEKKREDYILQTKVGIIAGERYNFSKDYLIGAVEASLKRLKMDYVDALLLHRPDPLCEPEEVAAAFDYLEEKGMVRQFGVSNHTPMQIELLKKCVKQDIQANQLQFSITNAGMVSQGMTMNMANDYAVDRDGSVLDYCRLNDVTIQVWSPFQAGEVGVNMRSFLDNPEFPEVNNVLEALAKKYDVTKAAVAAAWILRHPANMQVIMGTTKAAHLKEACKATDFRLTGDEWYDLYKAAGNLIP